ncbi:MAG TPA: NUDIX hydrolase [Opitutaceae bacterium]|nr:NUDIX hydrolase [Opitutaceae bacterium]
MESLSHPPSRWEKTGDTIHASCRIFDVHSPRYRHPKRGTERTFFTIETSDWVNVLAVTVDRQIVLVRQFRYGIDTFSLEIPGGVIDLGEDPVEAGLRELREEAGFSGENARIIGRVHPNPAIQNNTCHLVLVENAKRTHELEWDTDEELEVLIAPVDEVYAMVQQGQITHAMVLDALLFFVPHWSRLKERPV